MVKRSMISVRLTDSDMSRIRALSRQNDCSMSEVVRRIIVTATANPQLYIGLTCEDCEIDSHESCIGPAHCDCSH